MSTLRISLLIILCLAIGGCGDNGPLSTYMGKNDYTFTLPEGWQDTHNDTTQIIMNSLWADETVPEHMPLNVKRPAGTPPTFIVVGSNRGGPYSREEVAIQYQKYLERPTKNTPLEVLSDLNTDTGVFSSEDLHENVIFLMRRVYTSKGYVQASVMCNLNDPTTTAEAKAVLSSLKPSADTVYQ